MVYHHPKGSPPFLSKWWLSDYRQIASMSSYTQIPWQIMSPYMSIPSRKKLAGIAREKMAGPKKGSITQLLTIY